MAQHQNIGENALYDILLLMKNRFVSKVLKTGSTSEYKVMSDNDLTNDLKANYDAAYSHSQLDHAPANAQENTVEKIKVNGNEMLIENKTIDIPVPLVSNDVSTDKDMSTKAVSPKAVYDYVTAALVGVSGGLTFKILTEGEYDTETGLPTLAGDSGYIYLVPISGGINDAYKEFIYVNAAYECIGTTEVDLTGYMKTTDLVEFTTAEINAIWTSVMSS